MMCTYVATGVFAQAVRSGSLKGKGFEVKGLSTGRAHLWQGGGYLRKLLSRKACLRHCARVVEGSHAGHHSRSNDRLPTRTSRVTAIYYHPNCELLNLKHGESNDRSGSTLCQRKGVFLFLALEARGGALILSSNQSQSL